MDWEQLRYPAVIALAAGVFVGCGSEEPISEPEEELAVERVHPEISIAYPERGTFAEAGQITMDGALTVGSADIEEVSVNGEAIAWSGEHFATNLTLRPGPNIFGLRVEAEDRGRAVDSMSVYGPSIHEPEAVLEHALYIRLGQEVLDNDTEQLDDVAGITEALLKDEEFLLWMFSEPFEAGDMGTVQVTRIEASDVAIDLIAAPGCLETTIELGATQAGDGGGVEADLHAEGLVSILGEEIMMSAERIYVHTDICTVDNADGIELETRDPQVEIDGFRLSTNEHPDLSDNYPDTVESVSETAEEALEEWLGESMADLIGDFLRDFVSDYVFGIDPQVTVALGIDKLVIDQSGITLDLFGQFTAPQNLSFDASNSGSANAEVTPLPDDFSKAPMAVAMSTDALNQLLFAMWYGGGFEEEVDPDLEALGELPAVFQPITDLGYKLWLPPAFVPPTHPEDFLFDFAVGGIDVDLMAGEGRLFDIGLEIQAGVGIDVDTEGQLDLQFDNRPQFITVQAALDAVPEGLDGGDVAALLRMMIPSVLGELDVILQGFAIPSIDVGDFGEGLSQFQGREVTFVPERIDHAGEQGMYLLVEGSFSEVTGN